MPVGMSALSGSPYPGIHGNITFVAPFSAGSTPPLGQGFVSFPRFLPVFVSFEKFDSPAFTSAFPSPAVSFAQRVVEVLDEVVPAACLVGRRAEMFRSGRRGELNSLAGEAVERGEPQ